MATLADEVDYRPVPLPHLHITHLQPDQLRSAQTATKQERQHRVVAFLAEVLTSRVVQNFRALFQD